MQMVLKPITKQNRAEALALHVAKGQEGFVESVAQCLKEANEYDVWRPVALYVEGKMVGFAMYGFSRCICPRDVFGWTGCSLTNGFSIKDMAKRRCSFCWSS